MQNCSSPWDGRVTRGGLCRELMSSGITLLDSPTYAPVSSPVKAFKQGPHDRLPSKSHVHLPGGGGGGDVQAKLLEKSRVRENAHVPPPSAV